MIALVCAGGTILVLALVVAVIFYRRICAPRTHPQKKAAATVYAAHNGYGVYHQNTNGYVKYSPVKMLSENGGTIDPPINNGHAVGVNTNGYAHAAPLVPTRDATSPYSTIRTTALENQEKHKRQEKRTRIKFAGSPQLFEPFDPDEQQNDGTDDSGFLDADTTTLAATHKTGLQSQCNYHQTVVVQQQNSALLPRRRVKTPHSSGFSSPSSTPPEDPGNRVLKRYSLPNGKTAPLADDLEAIDGLFDTTTVAHSMRETSL